MSCPPKGYLHNVVARDLFDVLCGDLIDSGVARYVYKCRIDPELVVKVETESCSFQNIVEWEVWQQCEHHKASARWLAPCKMISACGTVLVMSRTTPVIDYPTSMPRFLSDFKRTNYGMYQGQVVCHDYGTLMLVNVNNPLRLRKVEWWDANPTE